MDDLLDEVLADDGVPCVEQPTDFDTTTAPVTSTPQGSPSRGAQNGPEDEPELTEDDILNNSIGIGVDLESSVIAHPALKVSIPEFEPVSGKMCYKVLTEVRSH